MQTQHHPLVSPVLGTLRQITSFHYGAAGTGQKVYIQSSLHADELPGMLVAWALRRKLAEYEAACCIRGEIVIVPVANPIGVNQQWLGRTAGRFESNTGQNFNRHFLDLTEHVVPHIEAQLTSDIDANRRAIRALMLATLAAQPAHTELASQRLALQRLACDADVVLDLHCDLEGAMHLYTSPDGWAEVEPLARYIDAKACLMASDSVGNPFDEVHSMCWSALRKRYGAQFPIPDGAVSVTLELRGQHDVTYAYAEQDAQAIVNYLAHRRIIDAPLAPLPPLSFPATPLAGTETLLASVSGIVVFLAELGTWIAEGTPVADIVDPFTDHVVTLTSTVSGVLFARHKMRFAHAGMEVAHIAGAMPRRSGSLLSH